MSRLASRALIFALMLIIPLRLFAAGVVPIVGMPGHAHGAGAHGDLAAVQDHAPGAGKHDGCAAHADSLDAPADSLHEHSCPHLAMTSMTAPVLAAALDSQRPRVTAPVALAFESVVLDVPSPPPTARI
jgi:hypothetical protein